TRTAIPATAYRLLIRGIQIEQCANALIHDNTSERLGLSVKGAGSLLGTQFKCNTSNGSYNGFYFDASYNSVQTAISKQGDSTHPTDNKWTFYSTYYGIDGPYNAPVKKWFYRNSAPYIPTEPLALMSFIQLTPAVNPVAVNCASCTYGYLMAGNSIPSEYQTANSLSTNSDLSEMDAIMNESNSYNELDESFRYFEKQYAFHKLDANSQSLNAITGNYYYDLKNSNIGRFENVYSQVEEGQIENAKLLNNQINPSNNIENYRKWVNSIYFDFVVPQKPIPQNTVDELITLASSSPFVNGDAVYTARAIVGYTEPEINNKNMEQDNQQDENIANSNVKVRVYPNPAERNITVELIGIQEELCSFIIRNTLGINLLEKVIKTDGSPITIDVGKLSNGLYLYEVLNSEKVIIDKGSLVISK
ncbi:MAG TPA: T9SS type A sorting domain-containing protein, partial [Chitinophagaceae bacterium]|nr:T9SS type A sorting domain-containing protein [Chitinophagaceae bacterium]